MIKQKPAHTGVYALEYGPLVYAVIRHDGKLCGLYQTRHEAAGSLTRLHECDDYEIRAVPTGRVPIDDVWPNIRTEGSDDD